MATKGESRLGSTAIALEHVVDGVSALLLTRIRFSHGVAPAAGRVVWRQKDVHPHCSLPPPRSAGGVMGDTM